MNLLVIADIITVLGAVLGAPIIALNIGMNTLGYCLFAASSIAGTYLLYRGETRSSLKLVSVYFFVVNVLGILRG
jgi:hypothetical protein